MMLSTCLGKLSSRRIQQHTNSLLPDRPGRLSVGVDAYAKGMPEASRERRCDGHDRISCSSSPNNEPLVRTIPPGFDA